MNNDLELRLIKNPVTGEKDTVLGVRRQNGELSVEFAVLIDNPIYLEWVSQGKEVVEELDE